MGKINPYWKTTSSYTSNIGGLALAGLPSTRTDKHQNKNAENLLTFENLAVNKFCLQLSFSADKFSNELQILGHRIIQQIREL